MGEFQSLKQIEGLEMSSISADLYKDGRDDLALFYFSKGANYATLTTSNNVTLTFTNFPQEDDASTNTHASMRVFLTKGTSTHTVTLTGVSFPTVASFNESNLDSSTMSTTFPDRKSTFVFDVFSVDGGTTKFISTILEYPSSS